MRSLDPLALVRDRELRVPDRACWAHGRAQRAPTTLLLGSLSRAWPRPLAENGRRGVKKCPPATRIAARPRTPSKTSTDTTGCNRGRAGRASREACCTRSKSSAAAAGARSSRVLACEVSTLRPAPVAVAGLPTQQIILPFHRARAREAHSIMAEAASRPRWRRSRRVGRAGGHRP